MENIRQELKDVDLNEEEISVVAQYLLERRDYHSKNRKQIVVPENFAKMTNAEKSQFFSREFYDRVKRDVTKFLGSNIFDGVKFFNDDEKKSAVIQEVCDLYSSIISPYANSASLTIDATEVLSEKNPFSKGAMRKVVITKELGADGSYNTKYSHIDSGLEAIYDKNGVLIMDNIGAGNDFVAIAKGLWNKGFNWTYLENADVWFNTKGIDGKTPEQSVKGYTIIPRNDERALEIVGELEELSKEIITENVAPSPQKVQDAHREKRQKEIDTIEEKIDKKLKKQRENLEESAKTLDDLNAAGREGKREIKELDWELQPKTAEQVEDDYDKNRRSLYAEEVWDRMKGKIKNGETLGSVEKMSIDDYVRTMCDEGQTMIDGWKILCKEVPYAYQYLPTKYFQGEHCPAEEIIMAAKEGMREFLEGKDNFSADDIQMVDSFSQMLDNKNVKEQETVAEIRGEAEKQDTLKKSLMDKINDAGKFK